MRCHSSVSVYWLWLFILGGILAVAPSVPFHAKMGGTRFLNIAFLYRDALHGDARSWSAMGDDKWMMLHAAVSAALAVVATVIHHVLAKRRDPEYRSDSKNFSLGEVLFFTVALACVFSILAFLGAIHAIYAAVFIFVAGRLATLLLAAIGL
jgi:hypothetical protein